MATMNEHGNIQANCPGCNGALSTFSWRSSSTRQEYGCVVAGSHYIHGTHIYREHRLFRCEGCERGAFAEIMRMGNVFPGTNPKLVALYPEARDRLTIPAGVPEGIKNEFIEGEKCMEAGCIRAAAGMFRSVLDKTLRANGYKESKGTSLAAQIDAVAADGIITAARQKKAHDEIRVLGNDVLHDEWQLIPMEDVEAARHYAQRILEDLYDDRPSVLALLHKAGRILDEDRLKAVAA